MTSLEKLCKANRWRHREGRFGTDETAGWNGLFLVPIAGEIWKVIISDGQGWRHLSATNLRAKVMPSWAVMSQLHQFFFGDDEWTVEFHTPKDEHINDHPYCLHLWSPLNEPLPKPPIILV